MDVRCAKANIFDQKTSDIDSLLDMDHIATCSECSLLLDGHRKLELAFQGEPQHSPSIHFYRELKNRLKEEQHYERQVRRRALVLRGYWLFATIASLTILWMVPWPEQIVSSPVVPSIIMFLSLIAVVPTMIYRSLRLDRSLF